MKQTIQEAERAAAHVLVRVLEKQLAAARAVAGGLDDQAPAAARWEIDADGSVVGHLEPLDPLSAQATVNTWARLLDGEVTSEPQFLEAGTQTMHVDCVMDHVAFTVTTDALTDPRSVA